MSQISQIILWIIILVLVYILSRRVQTWKVKRAYFAIINELKQQEAFDSHSAVKLPWDKRTVFRFGTRDYRPRALDYLVLSNIVGMTDDGRHYLKSRDVGPLPKDKAK
ncbi:MAG: hypothetical protein DRG87_05795 [Deltaproteobacteria bacterium]|nr:MAG: hypothetical protein DRG87_05795 [Deltaproteobacteria bacterium]